MPRSSSGLLIKICLHSVPILIAPRLFGLRNQILRNTPMYEHQLRPTIGRSLQRDRCHREDAFGESAVSPSLNDASSRNEVDVDSGDIALTDGECSANLTADDRSPTDDRTVLSGISKQIIDGRGICLEFHTLLDGLAHDFLL